MPLTCYCDWEPEAGDWCFYGVNDYAPLATKCSRRCRSCGEKIAVGDLCCKAARFRVPLHDVEVKIYGEDGEIPIAPIFMCERCSDLFWSLFELGFECISPAEDMRQLVRDYAMDYGPKPTAAAPTTESR